VAGALGTGAIDATAATIIFVAGAVLSSIWLVIDPWARRLFDRWTPDLRVTIEQTDWDNFRHEARILEMRVSIRNRKNRRKRITGFTFQHQGGGIPANLGIEVLRKVERRAQSHPPLTNHSIVEPRSTVTGWVVYPLPLSQNPGEPDFTFSVSDELEVEYKARRR
jgi:hypothetical protein